MIKLIAQFDKFSGPDAIGQHKIVFSMDESINQGEFNPMSIKKGTQFMMTLIEAGSLEETEFNQETAEETLERFRKQFYALITEVAEIRHANPAAFKAELKQEMIRRGAIKESTKELSIEQLAQEIATLKRFKATL